MIAYAAAAQLTATLLFVHEAHGLSGMLKLITSTHRPVSSLAVPAVSAVVSLHPAPALQDMHSKD